jgi:hypothetical protein
MSSPVDQIVAEHIDIWNSPPGEERTRAIASTYASDVLVAEPDSVHHGHAGLAQVIDGLQSVPGMVITVTSTVQTTQSISTYSWAFGPEVGRPVVTGRDILNIRDGLVTSLHVLIDPRQT